MKIRTFESWDTEKIFTLWNSAHPYTPLTKELITRKIFLDSNFAPENFLVAEKDGDVIGMVYVPHRFFAIKKDGDREEATGFITYFAVKEGYKIGEVGHKLLDAAMEHHKSNKRKYLTTAYTPLYFMQGFLEGYDNEYIELFKAHGFKEGRSYKRSIDLETYNLPFDFEERKEKLEKEGIYIGALTYEYISQFLSPELDYSNSSWAWEFRTRLSSKLDLETARVAVSEGRVIGGCIFSDPNSDEGRFGPLGISPSCRGRGIGSLLFADCLNEMKKRGIKTAWAQWTPSSGAAHTLYEKAGFKITDCIVSFTKEI